MVDAEPIIVHIRADTAQLTTGLQQGKQSLKEFGDETERVDGKQLKMFRTTGSVFGGLLMLRGGLAATKDLLKGLGIQSEGASKALDAMGMVLSGLIIINAAYQAKAALSAIANFLLAKSWFATAVAQVSASSFFVGTAVAVGAALAAWAAISALSAPRAQHGAIIPPTAGGSLIRAGEAGQTEVIFPLDRLRGMGFGGGDINMTVNVQTDDPDHLIRVLGRKIQQVKAAGG